MATIKTLRAIRYSDDIDLSEVTAPPYDVITPDMKAGLEQRHPFNVIHLTLGPSLPGEGEDRYKRSGETFRRWLSEGVIVEEDAESFFLYRFDSADGSASAALVAAVQLEPTGQGNILPHERTMTGPKADRLALTRAASANLEPLWFISDRTMGVISRTWARVQGDEPIADIKDDQDVRHRLWRVPGDLDQGVRDAAASVQLVIADGHHRYETFVAYRDERRAERGPGAWDFTLAMIQDPVDLGPILRPIHRFVARLDLRTLSQKVNLTPFIGDLEALESSVAAAGPGTVGVVSSKDRFTVRTNAEPDTAWLNQLFEELGAETVYEHRLSEVARSLLEGGVAFLLAPIGVETVTSMASAGRLMPPKTTLFWPKPLSGLVMRRLG